MFQLLVAWVLTTCRDQRITQWLFDENLFYRTHMQMGYGARARKGPEVLAVRQLVGSEVGRGRLLPHPARGGRVQNRVVHRRRLGQSERASRCQPN